MKRLMCRQAGIGMLLLALMLPGCAWFKSDEPRMEKSAQTLATEGAADYRNGDYRDAIRAFTTLRDWYPFSKYAILAELKIADAHFRLEEYEEAAIAYREFENLHPSNEAIPHVIYRQGMCWFHRIPSVDKDQTPSSKALVEFQRLTERFPGTPQSRRAHKRIQHCLNQLAGHEAYVAEYYFKKKQYKAALKRYEQLFAVYPDTPHGREALKNISRCRKAMDDAAT